MSIRTELSALAHLANAGETCELWGIRAAEMTRSELLVLVGYLNEYVGFIRGVTARGAAVATSAAENADNAMIHVREVLP